MGMLGDIIPQTSSSRLWLVSIRKQYQSFVQKSGPGSRREASDPICASSCSSSEMLSREAAHKGQRQVCRPLARLGCCPKPCKGFHPLTLPRFAQKKAVLNQGRITRQIQSKTGERSTLAASPVYSVSREKRFTQRPPPAHPRRSCARSPRRSGSSPWPHSPRPWR